MTPPSSSLGARRRASNASPGRIAAGAELSSLIAPHDHWLSSAAVREALGAWAYTRAGGQGRPAPADVRAAVGVAAALVEQERAQLLEMASDGLRTGPTASRPLQSEIPEDVAGLVDRSGYGASDVRAALDLLTAARFVSRRIGATMPTVILDASALVPAPVAARIQWPQVRARLRTAGGSIPPALAVLRELAVAVGAPGDAPDPPSVRASVRELEDRTAFGRSTVCDALAALERADVLAVETRAGRTTRFVLRVAAPGWPPPAAPATEHRAEVAPARPPIAHTAGRATSRTRSGAGEGAGQGMAPSPPSVTSAGDVAPRAPGATGAPVLIGDFAGTPIHAPAGTPLVLEQNADGGWTCRVGPFLRLGPVHPPE